MTRPAGARTGQPTTPADRQAHDDAGQTHRDAYDLDARLRRGDTIPGRPTR